MVTCQKCEFSDMYECVDGLRRTIGFTRAEAILAFLKLYYKNAIN